MMPMGAGLVIVKKALGITRQSPRKSSETESWTHSTMFSLSPGKDEDERKAQEDSLPVVV